MSPVERTAAWVLNNGQYEEEEGGGGQIREEGKKTEKVSMSFVWNVLLNILVNTNLNIL